MVINNQGYNLIDIHLSEAASLVNLKIIGNDININGLNLSNREVQSSSVLSYCTSTRYLNKAISNKQVKALIIPNAIYKDLSTEYKSGMSFIISDTPEYTFYTIFIKLSLSKYPRYSWNTDFKNAIISKGAIIEKGVLLGNNVIIGNNSVIKSGSIIGDNVNIGACSVIGGNGFQLIKDDNGVNMSIPHVGRVFIGTNVSIGDNTTISKSLFEGFTSVGNNSKIDNHVHIAHNCIIGDNCVLTANCSMFGSSELETNVWLAPNSAIMNKVIVGSNAFIGASSFVSRNVKPGSRMFGIPAININE
ncbi:MAG: UDP-3-O-(3-hydroxymyristoyl) glucosamine N-acyltransferase [Bacteroidales bacterium]|nr:UDP-3-O-(3-hydroxymyristoyl) glucosamine N-acyltransferase [Bacteroidales bacterium]